MLESHLISTHPRKSLHVAWADLMWLTNFAGLNGLLLGGTFFGVQKGLDFLNRCVVLLSRGPKARDIVANRLTQFWLSVLYAYSRGKTDAQEGDGALWIYPVSNACGAHSCMCCMCCM